MIARDYLIIGAGAAGLGAAEGIRQHDRRGKVTLIGNEGHAPYHRPGLSKSFLRAKDEPTALAEGRLRPAEWYAGENVELRLGVFVTQFNLERRLAVLSTGQTIEFNKALLATGSRPVRPQVAGYNLGNVLYLRTLADALALREMAATEKEIVVCGGGLVALEAAAALRVGGGKGRKITVLAREATLWANYLDAETSAWLAARFRAEGVTLHLGEHLNGFEGKTTLRNVQTKSGVRLPAGLALVACGVEMNLELVRNTPLSSPKGTPVSELLETDEKGIYAAGDIALFPDKIFGGARRVDHWDSSRAQGLLAGANMTGKKRQRYECIPDWGSEVFGMGLRFIGDFATSPTRTELEGTREGKEPSFILRHYFGDRLRAAVLVNRPDEEEAETIKRTIRAAHTPGTKG